MEHTNVRSSPIPAYDDLSGCPLSRNRQLRLTDLDGRNAEAGAAVFLSLLRANYGHNPARPHRADEEHKTSHKHGRIDDHAGTTSSIYGRRQTSLRVSSV